MNKIFTPLLKYAVIAPLFFSQVNLYAAERELREPEAATGYIEKHAITSKKFMVASANPYASKAGYNILKQGGSAVDAAVAIQMVLTLVEPQSSGIGGGAFILHWDQKHKKLISFDGRETAPQAATPVLFFEQGKAVPWIKAVVGGRSVGVPGALHALYTAHQKYGKLPWHKLFDDAIKLAEQGFTVSPRMAKLVALELNPGMTKLPAIKKYLYPHGKALQAGDTLVNKPLAKVFKAIAKQGIKPFYQGWIAKKIVAAVQGAEIAPGKLSLTDLKNYQSKQRDAVCTTYHQYQVCGMAPPSSGGITVAQILGQLQLFKLGQYQPNDITALHLFTQSSRLAFADRARYLADSDFVAVPVAQMLAPDYLAKRAQLIDKKQDMPQAQAGELTLTAQADDNAYELPCTSHISIVDADGNAVSMTTSIEMAFGSTVMAEGFILNNQLTDFSLDPKRNGHWVANRVEPNKRPRSSMSPTMVFNQDGSFKLAVGSPGGSRIIDYVAQTLIGILDWQLDPQQAINLPKITNRNRYTTLEKGTPLANQATAFKALGHSIKIQDLNSGLHAVMKTGKGLIGGADPRREGLVLGD